MGKINKFIAHIDRWDKEQSLKNHCQKTAEYTGAFLKKLGLYHLGYLLGMIHDMGKATRRFRWYIWCVHNRQKVKRGSVNHTFAAVIYILEKYNDSDDEFQVFTSELVAYAVGAHHGLFDCIAMDGKSGFLYRLQKDREEICYEEAIKNFFEFVMSEEDVNALFLEASKEVKELGKKIDLFRNEFYRSMLTRLLVSALIDGDRQDTAEFMRGKKLPEKKADDSFWDKHLKFYEGKIEKLSHTDDDSGNLQKARQYISDSCFLKAKEGTGIYTLSAMTGGGKTLAALRYALAHALAEKKERVFFITPLLSILEQNSQVVREYIQDKDSILEFHSNILQFQETKEELNAYELAAETMHAPFVITTLVQFLNILFDGKTVSVRRMQALCNSIIVIDEVQDLPWRVTAMFNQAMNFLSACCNTTIILCSATQPCFKSVEPSLNLAQKAEMVPPNPELFQKLKRTRIKDGTRPEGYTTREVADFADTLLQTVSSVLVVCNTRKTAREIYQFAQKKNYQVFHLSTSMCMENRKGQMEKMQEILNYNIEIKKKESKTKECKTKKILCVSTQVMEAGVNTSFEAAIRINAGLDNAIQIAGRCNRSFEYRHICEVYILNLKDESLLFLKEIRQRQEAMNKFLNAFHTYQNKYDGDLASEKSIEEYYRCLFQALQRSGSLKYVVEEKGPFVSLYGLLTRGVESADADNQILTQPFKTVGDLFQVFDTCTTDVIVPYDEKSRALITELSACKEEKEFDYVKRLLRRTTPYCIRLFQYEMDRHADKIIKKEIGRQCFYILKEGYYDTEMGFVGEE